MGDQDSLGSDSPDHQHDDAGREKQSAENSTLSSHLAHFGSEKQAAENLLRMCRHPG